MMNLIFAAMIIIAVVCACVTGKGSELAQGVIDGAAESIQLLITMSGMMLLWSGIMEIARRGGFTSIVGRLLSPVLRRLFKKLPKDSKALCYISMNVSANLLENRQCRDAVRNFGYEGAKKTLAAQRQSQRRDGSIRTY